MISLLRVSFLRAETIDFRHFFFWPGASPPEEDRLSGKRLQTVLPLKGQLLCQS